MKFTFDPEKSWQENFEALQEHHEATVKALQEEIDRLTPKPTPVWALKPLLGKNIQFDRAEEGFYTAKSTDVYQTPRWDPEWEEYIERIRKGSNDGDSDDE